MSNMDNDDQDEQEQPLFTMRTGGDDLILLELDWLKCSMPNGNWLLPLVEDNEQKPKG